MSKIRTLALGASFAAALLAAPSFALAASEFHPAPGEKGYTEHPSHRVLNQDRATVVADRNAALGMQPQRVGPIGDRMSTSAQRIQGAGLSRGEVEQEALRAMRAGEIIKGD